MCKIQPLNTAGCYLFLSHLRGPRSDTACSSLADLADRPHIATTTSNVAGSPLFNLISAIVHAHLSGTSHDSRVRTVFSPRRFFLSPLLSMCVPHSNGRCSGTAPACSQVFCPLLLTARRHCSCSLNGIPHQVRDKITVSHKLSDKIPTGTSATTPVPIRHRWSGSRTLTTKHSVLLSLKEITYDNGLC